MNWFSAIGLTLFLEHFSLLTVGQQTTSSGINTVPRYGYARKNASHLSADQQFISATLRESGGDRLAASNKYVDIGWRYFYFEDLPNSIKRFNQAWLLDSTNADVYFGFGAYLQQTGDTTAVRKYQRLGQQRDINRQAELKYYSRLADLHNKKQDALQLIEDYSRILAINPRFPGAYSIIGYNYMVLRDTTQAIQYLNKAIANDPRDTLAYLNKGWLYYQHQRYAKAVAEFTQALAINPSYISAFVNRGLAQVELGNFAAALADYRRGLELAPVQDRGQFHRLIGQAKLRMNDRAGACSAFRLALALNDSTIDRAELQKLFATSCP